MFRPRQVIPLIVAVLPGVFSGCGIRQDREDLTFRCGVEALAAGSPKSAIPFLSQVVASYPEAPRPRAMLAMAYALDLQPGLAVRQAELVRRDPKTDGPPGWEYVAMGIAAMTRHDPSGAVCRFEKVCSAAGAEPGMKCAAAQWLTLALLLKGDDKAALARLVRLGRDKEARTTTLLWSVLIHGHKGKNSEAAKSLTEIASQVAGRGRARAMEAVDAAKADDRDVCDAGIAAIRRGELAGAKKLFMTLHTRSANASDAQVWLALVAAAQGKWEETTGRLKKGCGEGPYRSRSLSNHLFSVVCALEGRPHALIQHLLTGRRLAGRNRLHVQVPGKAKANSSSFRDKFDRIFRRRRRPVARANRSRPLPRR